MTAKILVERALNFAIMACGLLATLHPLVQRFAIERTMTAMESRMKRRSVLSGRYAKKEGVSLNATQESVQRDCSVKTECAKEISVKM